MKWGFPQLEQKQAIMLRAGTKKKKQSAAFYQLSGGAILRFNSHDRQGDMLLGTGARESRLQASLPRGGGQRGRGWGRGRGRGRAAGQLTGSAAVSASTLKVCCSMKAEMSKILNTA